MPSLLVWSLGALAVFHRSTLANDEITSDSYFYGQSPPVYPAPSVSPVGAWSDAVAKALDLVSQMTLEEKVNFTSGVTSNTGCSGMIPALKRLNFTGLCLSDAGNGVRATDFVSAWPSGLHVGASWNKDLTHLRAHYMGREAKIKGVNALLGPCIGPVGRVVEGGRNWESFSVDPYLSGTLVHKTVEGIQGAGVIATTKHFIGNEQETSRLAHGDQESLSSNIDDRTMHELYLWPFQDAVHAGTGSVMCSYNRLNNSHACQNSKTQNGLLKGELGFQGYIVSDWTAQQSGVASALAGLDMAMPNGAGKWEGNLTVAINNGSVPESRLNDMVTRILAPWFLMNQDTDFPSPGVGMPADLNAPHLIVDARTKASKSVLFDGAAEGHVLVKNLNNSLPLDSSSMKLISIFGYSAKATDVNNPGKPATGEFFAPWTAGLQPATNKTLENKSFLGGFGFAFNPTAKAGTMISGGGSGATADSWYSAPYDALVRQAGEDGTMLYWDFESGSPYVHPESNACLVFGNVWSTEGHDRPSLRDDYTDGLVLNVAKHCSNTIVVLHNAGTRLVDQFVDHPNVTAIVFAHLPGEQSGNALVSILYGKVNPSGRLPYTVAKNETDYGSLLEPEFQYPDNTTYALFPQSDFTEGVYLDYRHFDAQNIAPRYEFGFGLSYTTFEYRNLAISKVGDAGWQAYPQKNVSEGGQVDLWDELVEVSASVTNSGSMDGKEVAQLYLGIPGQNTPTKQLRGFEKPFIGAGETVTVRFALTRRDLSIWDVSAQKWLLQQGQYAVYVGSSSRNLPLTASFSI